MPLKASTASPIFLANNTPPPGFEDAIVRESTLVDVYYGNRFLTAQLASFTNNIFEFSNPAEIVQLIGDLNDPELITEALSGEISSNSDLLCFDNNSEDCGRLETPIAGVIFDPGIYRVDVFVNRRFMLTRAADVRKYLPPSDAGFALLQNFSAAVSGSTNANSSNDYTLNGQSMMAWEENSLYTTWDLSRANNLSVNQMYGQRDFEGLEYNLGLMSSQGFGLSFTSDQTMLGARIRSSASTRTDDSFTSGMPIEVFLPVRGRVEIRRDERLISSSFFEAGAQQLDTSRFPSGAYDIEIRVVDEQGNEQSRETRFFAKQYQLPPIDEWLFFAESGRVVDRNTAAILPELESAWVHRAGVSRRLFDTLSATAAIAHVNEENLAELGFFQMGYRYELAPSLMVSDRGDTGVSVNARGRLGNLSLNGNYRRLWRKDKTNTASGVQLLGSAFEQLTTSTAMPFLGGSLNYRYSLSRNDDLTQTHSVDYRRTVFRTREYDLDMIMNFSESGDNRIALLSFNLRYRLDRWNFRASPRSEFRKNSDGSDQTHRVRLSTSWDDGDLLDGKLSFNAGFDAGTGDERLDASSQYANRFGRVGLNLNHVDSAAGNNTAYSGSFSTSFLTDGNVIAMGGEQRSESALVINVDGRKGDVFDVRINGQRRGYAVAGRSSVVSLPPFERYRVTLSPAGNSLYSFDERQRFVTLYPGNVVTLDYEAVPLQLMFGRLLFNGEPLTGARLGGGLFPASTDDIGMFQLEGRSDIETLQVELENDWICQLPVTANEKGYVVQVGTVDLAESECSPVLDGELAVTKRSQTDQ